MRRMALGWRSDAPQAAEVVKARRAGTSWLLMRKVPPPAYLRMALERAPCEGDLHCSFPDSSTAPGLQLLTEILRRAPKSICTPFYPDGSHGALEMPTALMIINLPGGSSATSTTKDRPSSLPPYSLNPIRSDGVLAGAHSRGCLAPIEGQDQRRSRYSIRRSG